MANEKNVNEKVENAKVEEAKAAHVPMMKQGFTNFNSNTMNSESEKNTSGEVDGIETVYTETDTRLFLEINPGKDKRGVMRDWYNFHVRFGLFIGFDEKNEPIYHEQRAYFNAVSRDKGDMVFTLIKMAYANTDNVPVDIIKTTRTINDIKQISYSVRLKFKTPTGINLKFDFNPSQKSDRETFDNYISALVDTGIIK